MAEVVLKNIKKVYPNLEPKKGKKAEGEHKHNLKVTEEGVLAVQDFNLDIQDREFIVPPFIFSGIVSASVSFSGYLHRGDIPADICRKAYISIRCV